MRRICEGRATGDRTSPSRAIVLIVASSLTIFLLACLSLMGPSKPDVFTPVALTTPTLLAGLILTRRSDWGYLILASLLLVTWRTRVLGRPWG